MRLLILAVAAASLLIGTIAARADEGVGTGPRVLLVSGGCGIGFHRGPAGFCRANAYRSRQVYYGVGFGQQRRTTATGGNAGGYSDRN